MDFPLILQLDKAGLPHKWITYEKAVYYICKDLVLWVGGADEHTVRGGTNRITGTQSTLSVNTVMSIDGIARAKTGTYKPIVSNQILFRRDLRKCAYCGQTYPEAMLTCDHIIPRTHGGKNEWMNVISSCKPCNSGKSDRSLAQCGLTLLYDPYIPTRHEYMMLRHTQLLDDQYDFLVRHINPTSRVVELFSDRMLHRKKDQ